MVEEPQENYLSGWVKLFRSIENKGWYKDSNYVHLWVHLIFKANHEGKEWLYKGRVFKVKRGQFITSRKSLSQETGICEAKVERILKCFKSEQQIEQQNLFTNRLISINNYDVYQKNGQQNEQQVNSERTASEQQVNTTKEYKNLRTEGLGKPNLSVTTDAVTTISLLKTDELFTEQSCVGLKTTKERWGAFVDFKINMWKAGNLLTQHPVNSFRMWLVKDFPEWDRKTPAIQTENEKNRNFNREAGTHDKEYQ